MKYKTSFFNKGVLKNDLKRFSWIGILYSLLLIFIIPFKILTTYSRNISNDYTISIQDIFQFHDIIIVSMFFVPIITAIFLFRYIQNRKPVDMVHSLPVKRVTLYDNHVFFGIITIVIPVILTTIISCILKSTLHLNNLDLYFTYKNVFVWCGTNILFSVFTFLFTVLIGMLTGLSTAQGILTCIFLLLPAGLSLLIIENVRIFLFGSKINSYYDFIEILSPFTRANRIPGTPLTIIEITIYITLSIIIYALARFSYVKRNLESATNAVAFKNLQPIFKYGVTFCCTLVGGLYFKETQYGLSWTIFGYFIAGLIGYFIAEMIIKKSIRVFKNIKGYFIYAGIISILLLCVKFDITGYEKRIPDTSQIQNIYLANHFYSNDYEDKASGYPKSFLYYEKDNIENIKKLHKEIIENKNIIKDSKSMRYTSFAIKYNLKNGKEIKRQYHFPTELFKDHIKPIYESKEYKINNFDILKVNKNIIDKITIFSSYTDKNLTIVDPTEIKEVADILKNVTLNKTYEEMLDVRSPWGRIDLLLSNDNRVEVPFLKTNKELENWLIAKNYLKNTRTIPENVDYILVAKRVNGHRIDLSSADVKKLKITDKAQIEKCLQNSCYEYLELIDCDAQYDISFVPKNKNLPSFQEVFDENHAPDFVKQYFK